MKVENFTGVLRRFLLGPARWKRCLLSWNGDFGGGHRLCSLLCSSSSLLRSLGTADLLTIGFDNPLRALGICPEELRAKLEGRGPRIEMDDRDLRFRLL